MTRKTSRPFDVSELSFMKDPENAALYLEECLADGDMEQFQEALRDVAKAQGGMASVAETANLGRESLYKALSKKGRPQMETVSKVLGALGMRLSVVPQSSPPDTQPHA